MERLLVDGKLKLLLDGRGVKSSKESWPLSCTSTLGIHVLGFTWIIFSQTNIHRLLPAGQAFHCECCALIPMCASSRHLTCSFSWTIWGMVFSQSVFFFFFLAHFFLFEIFTSALQNMAARRHIERILRRNIQSHTSSLSHGNDGLVLPFATTDSSQTAPSLWGEPLVFPRFEEYYSSSQTLSSETGEQEQSATEPDSVSVTTAEEGSQEDELRTPIKPDDCVAPEILVQQPVTPIRLTLRLRSKDNNPAEEKAEPASTGDEKTPSESLAGFGCEDSEASSVAEDGSDSTIRERGKAQQDGAEGASQQPAPADLREQIIPKVIPL